MAKSAPPPPPPRAIKVPREPIFRWPRTVRGWLILIVLVAMLLAGGFALYKWRSLYFGMPQLPETSELWETHREQAFEFIDRDGNTLDVRGPRYGRAADISTLPAFVPQAFIAAEDKRFYEHDGADDAAIARAALSNLRAGETVSGASTITQQLIKNLVLDNRQTLSRKAQEMKLARELETRISKDEVLSLYLNRVYFGAGLYGIDAAARYYFGKPPQELALPEAALLAALPKAPSKLNLRDNLEGALARQSYVLTEMTDLGFITKEQAAAARETRINIIEAPVYDAQLGYVLDTAGERAKAMLPRLPGDLVVTVSIDPKVQEKVEAMLTERMTKDGKAQGASQVGALVMAKDGRVVAMVGGMDYAASEYNRVTQAKRQPGSSFKPFVYAAALEDGYSPYDVMIDEPVTIDKWQPTNYGGGFLGPMTLSEALTRSTNTVAAQLGQAASEERIIALAKRFGMTTPMQPFPSLALGSQEVTMWELVRAYGAFQSGGLRLDPYLIDKIEDSRGNVLYQRPEYDRERVYPFELAEDMNAMLARVVNAPIGTGGRAKISKWTVAGKTGTSQDWRDAWFVGFTAAYVGAVWVGNDDDSAMKRVTGGGLPADLWSDMMEIVHAGKPPESLIGAEGGMVVSEAAEKRISFYRGLSQAFSVAASNRAAGNSSPQ
ncbi:transglycosylase domain-containing protein [Hyphomonas johnsonii]|uniref:1A family penicillin-binding protein n=1 Tax=Hyphomonas johnsonii MHS-2 TaxID=1280950 RepID=A0A059FTC2_9PROT|nr:PBP1A family penicillin-binding protein [Hyphomonas johnsonii]KCZ93751.1 1A family penicillin-binding protein [Hyphomonas johnsonii MHS-2]